MAILVFEDFETDGNGGRYTTSVPEFTDGSGDYFLRTDGSNISSSVAFSSVSGSFYFAGQDLNGEGAPSTLTIDLTTIDITGATNLLFSGLFAEDDASDGNEDWDAPDLFFVEASIDGGAYTKILQFTNDGSTFNTAPGLDADFDGIADGNLLTSTFENFSAAISGTGTTLDIRLTLSLDSGDEDIAFDDLSVSGDVGPEILLVEDFETDGNGTRYTTSVPEFSDGSGDFFTRTDGSNIGTFYNVTGQSGASYFGVMDTNGDGGPATVSVSLGTLDITGKSGLQVSALFAEDDDGVNQDWDADALVYLEASVDGGAYTKILQFASQGATNTEPGLDTDFDGVADGAALTSEFAEFVADVPGTGSTLDLRITFENLEAGDEDIALDFIKVVANGGDVVDTTPPTLITAVPADDSVNVAPDSNITLTFSESVAAGSGFVSIYNVADDSLIEAVDISAAAISGSSVVIDPIADLPQEKSVYVLIDAGAVVDQAGNSFAGLSDPTALNFDTRGDLRIGDIQGNAGNQLASGGLLDGSPLLGQLVTVSGVVVGDYQDGNGADGDLNGFYIQDPMGDGDVTTSDGIFVFTGTAPGFNVTVGDIVTVSGQVEEFFGQTQIDAAGTGGAVSVTGGGVDANTLVQTIDFSAITSTTDDDGDLIANLEAFEGMLVNFAQTITVAGLDNLDNFGEFVASAAGRLNQFTQDNAPDVAANTAYLDFVASRTFLVDDGFDGGATSIFRPDGAFGGDDEFRLGDTSPDLFGVLGYGFDNYRLRPVDADANGNPYDDVTFVGANPRPTSAPDVGGSLQVASFNVLNFFTTIDAPGASTTVGFDPRGADSAQEFDRQLEKLVTAILDLNAEVIGLTEIENDFDGLANNGTDDAITVLVDALNAAAGSTVYAFVDPGTDFVGTDAIANALIYDATKVQITPGTSAAILNDSVVATLPGFAGATAIFDGPNTNRAVLAASFEEIASGESFTVAINHFKSKGGNGSGDNADIGDGQAAFNGTRVRAAEAVQAWLLTDPTGSGDSDALVIGDLNSYAKEDPLTSFVAGGYVDTAAAFDANVYGYEFDGQLGTLDYGLANAALFSQVTGAAHYHINADEAQALDYNTEGRDLALFDGTLPIASSDHDPVLIGLALSGPLNVIVGTPFRDTLSGTSGADDIDGLAGSDSLLGLDGNDVINGSAGSDILRGGNGDDTLLGGVDGDLLRGNDGADMLFGEGGRDNLLGGTGDDTIDGGDSDDLARGEAGNDLMTDLLGANRLFGDAGDDTITAGDGNDTIRGGIGADSIDAGAGDDNITGGDGDDTIIGGEGNDIVFADNGNNVVDGGAGNDRLQSGSGDDSLTGGDGDDSLIGLSGNDDLDAGAGNDRVDAGLGDDTVFGRDGDDFLRGGSGADVITGGAGNDTMNGGFDNDVFVFALGDGQDTIEEFQRFGDDTLRFVGLGADFDTAEEILAVASQATPTSVLIDFGNGQSVTLGRYLLADLTLADIDIG